MPHNVCKSTEVYTLCLSVAASAFLCKVFNPKEKVSELLVIEIEMKHCYLSFLPQVPIKLISFALLSAHQAYQPPCASSFLITTQWQATQIFPLQAWSPYPYHWSHSLDQVWPPTLAPTQPIAILVLLPSFFLFANKQKYVCAQL